MPKKKLTLYKELSQRSELLSSESTLVRFTTELAGVMKQVGLTDKHMRKFVRQMDEGGWSDEVTEQVIWDIGEVLASQDPEILQGYERIQGWIYSISQTASYYNDLLKRYQSK